MARTIKEIANGMKSSFIGNEDLCTAFGLEYDPDRTDTDCIEYYDANFSAVSVETCLIYVVATCAAALENMFDWFKEDVDQIISEERYGHKGWYVKKAKEFEYNGAKIISHASCEEMPFGIKLKVAKLGNNGLCPLANGTGNTPDEYGSFQIWMNREKPAGMPINYVNIQADSLKIGIDCQYDPLVYTGGDDEVRQKIIDGINAYLNDIEFNGELSTTALVDSLQKLNGFGAIEITEAQAKPFGDNSYYQLFVSTCNPRSGYFSLDEAESTIDVTPIQ